MKLIITLLSASLLAIPTATAGCKDGDCKKKCEKKEETIMIAGKDCGKKKDCDKDKDEATLLAGNKDGCKCKKDCKEAEKKESTSLIAKDCDKKKDCDKDKDEATLIAKDCGKGCGGKKDKDEETLLLAA